MIAQSLLETVAARAADTEAQRHLPADLAAELAQAGLFRMLGPTSLGGAEVDVATLFNRLEQLGRADAATGWCVMIGGTTALISAWLPLEHAREIWADPGVITGGVFAPMGRATVDGENYLVSGRWAWGSGSANCSWLLGGAVTMEGGEMRRLPNGAPDHRMMVMRRHEVELIDTWDALGMRGTGSGDLAAKDVRVPQGRSVSFITDTPRETGPLYRFAPFGLLALGIAATTKSLAHAVAHPSTVRLLLAAGAPPGGLVRGVAESTVSPLMAAAEASSLESVRLLLGAVAGANVNRCNERGCTALMYALQSKATDATTVVDVVGALLDAGADANVRDATGRTPLQLLAMSHAAKPWAAGVARLLLASGASVQPQRVDARAPAACVPAGAGRDSELYRLLLDAEERA